MELELALAGVVGRLQSVERAHGDDVRRLGRRQDDWARAAAPADPQEGGDEAGDQRRAGVVDRQLGARVRVLERDRRVLGLALRVGLVGEQRGDREAVRGDGGGVHGAVGVDVGQRERRGLGLAGGEVLEGEGEDLAEALAGRLGLGLVDRDEVQRVELEAERDVDGEARRVGGGDLEFD